MDGIFYLREQATKESAKIIVLTPIVQFQFNR